jgi:hypothetical protein
MLWDCICAVMEGLYLEPISVIGLYFCHDGGTLPGTHQYYWIVFVP